MASEAKAGVLSPAFPTVSLTRAECRAYWHEMISWRLRIAHTVRILELLTRKEKPMVEIRIDITLRGVLVNFDPFVRAFHGATIESDTLAEAIIYALS